MSTSKIIAISAAIFSGAAAFLLAQEPQAPVSSSTTPAQQRAPAPAPARGNEAIRSFFGLSAPPDAAAVERGQKLFVTNCAFCHGTNANGGNSGPNLVRSVLVLHDEGTGKEIGPVILNGRPDRGMPKFNFTEAQIKDIAAFFLFRTQSTADRMDYKILNVVTGDPAKGQAFFAAHCGTCHTATGDLAHIANQYDPATLQGRMLYPMTRRFPGQPGPPPDPRTLTTATVTLPSGQTYKGVVAQHDDFSITITDATGPHTFPLDGDHPPTIEIHDPLAAHADLIPQYTDADMHNVLAYLETLK